MEQKTRLPGWFAALFVTVMLAVCAVIAFCTVEQYQLRFEVADLTLSLDTSRQRERKQEYEYNEVIAALPLVQAELEATQPLADEAVAAVNDLKARRKALRAENAELEAQLAVLQAEVAALQVQLDEAIAKFGHLK